MTSLQTTEGGDDKQISSSRSAKVTFRGIFHAFLTVLTWILFVCWWIQVIPQVSLEDAVVSFLVVTFTAIATSVLTLLWVRHNIGIFRRKGPRKGLPSVSEERLADSLGRTISHPGSDLLKISRVVLVSNEDSTKRFTCQERIENSESLDTSRGCR